MSFQVDNDWWKTIFDEIYLLTDGRTVCDAALTTAEVNFIESALNLDKSAWILDLCGGQGRHALELSQRGFANVTVLDYSDYLIRAGRKKAKEQTLNTIFVQGDARDTGLETKSFDSVLIMGGSFGYFVQNEENEKILRESCRILKQNGTLLLDLPDKSYVQKNFQSVSIHKPGKTIRVTRNRELQEDILYCKETVTCSEKGNLREKTYCIRLFSPEKIYRMLTKIGFFHVSFQEDFMPRKDTGDYGTMTNRMVVKCSKAC